MKLILNRTENLKEFKKIKESIVKLKSTLNFYHKKNLKTILNKSATPKHFPIIKAHGIQSQTKCKMIVKKKKFKIKPLSILDTFQLKKIYSFYDLTDKTKVGSKLLYDVRKDNITIKKSLLYK